MRKVREVLRLSFDGHMSIRRIAKSLGLSRSVVTDYLARFAASGLPWPLPSDLDVTALERHMFPPPTEDFAALSEPNWEAVRKAMQQTGATLFAIHKEYVEDGYPQSYTTFWRGYERFQKSLRRYMRQIHAAGEKVFVDFSGKTLTIHELETGRQRKAQIFAGVLGASLYTYAEAVWRQDLPNWIAAHTHMFAAFGGVPKMVICDNLKAGVTKASLTDPEINPTYLDMASHYGTMIFPARPREPQDKSPAENGVLLIQRWVLFRLRHRTFTTLEEGNQAIRELVQELNARPFQKLPGSRFSTFETIEKPALQPLPTSAYVYCEFLTVTVGADYHVDVDHHHYSVPYRLVSQVVQIRLTLTTIEVLHHERRVASHPRSRQAGGVTTAPEHMDPRHRAYREWTPERVIAWGQTIGPSTEAFVANLVSKYPNIALSYRSMGALRKLREEYGAARLEAACSVGLAHKAEQVSRIRSILKSKLDLRTTSEPEVKEADFPHPNVRGSDYYK